MSQSYSLLPSRAVNITSLAEFDRLATTAVETDAALARNWRVHQLDLRERTGMLRRLDYTGCLFIGCTFADGVQEQVQLHGALCLGQSTEAAPFNAQRRALYTAEELYAGIEQLRYRQVPDARIYAFAQQQAVPGRPTEEFALATTLHDHHVARALEHEVYEGKFSRSPIVGVMGGHDCVRGSESYAQAVHLGALLTRSGYSVATGGGPGAMEAANAGAWLAGYENPQIDEAIDMLAEAPLAQDSRTAWARSALAVQQRFARTGCSLGIPTWFYGHEPPNLFASHIAKFFANSMRESILLEQSNGGIIVLPGSAGTVQEIFQDACENYYAPSARVTPIVLVGVEHWTKTLPVYPLLKALSAGKSMRFRIALVDSGAAAVEFLQSVQPLRRRTRATLQS
ncbi:LOG family protein [Glutamicibacter endophyticus]